MEFNPFYYSKESKDVFFSKAFMKQAKSQLIPIFNSLIGETFDHRNSFINFGTEGSWGKQKIEKKNIMILEFAWLGLKPVYSFDFKLFWENLKGDEPIPINKENIENDEIRFWIEDFDANAVKNHLIKYAHYYRKTFVEGYRFVVEVKNPNTFFKIKILFRENISQEKAIEVENIIINYIVQYNEKDSDKTGFIKEFKMLKFKNKDFIDFYIDFDTAGENAFNGFVKLLNDSDFEIRKLEFDGK